MAGYLIVVTPDDKQSTKSTTVRLSGSADNDVVTLNDPSANRVFTLRKGAGFLTLSYPSTNGLVGRRDMKATSQEEFNQTLAAWQNDLVRQAQRAYLGVVTVPLTEDLAKQYNVKDEAGGLTVFGLLVTQVGEDSPAEWAGVQIGDAILTIGNSDAGRLAPDEGLPIAAVPDNFRPNDSVTLGISRDGKWIEIQVTLGVRPDVFPAPIPTPSVTPTPITWLQVGETGNLIGWQVRVNDVRHYFPGDAYGATREEREWAYMVVSMTVQNASDQNTPSLSTVSTDIASRWRASVVAGLQS